MSTSTATKKTSKKATGAASKKAAATTATKGRGKAASATTSGAGETTPFEKLFEDMLKDIYWAEQHLVEALQQMHEAATTEDLKNAFEDHLYVTQKHASRLEKVFGLLGVEAEAKQCDAMAGLISEAQRIIQETEEGSMTRDAGLIIAAQKVEHYEIASYGSLVQVALTLGHDDAAKILERTLSEEEDTDMMLTEIAETQVNPMADYETEDESEEGEEGGEESEYTEETEEQEYE